MEDRICISTPVLENTPRWFSPHTLLPAGSTLRPCQVHKNIPNKSAWCKEGNRKTLITSSHICESLFLGPMLITNTKRGLSLFWGIPRKHWNTYQAPASAIPSTILTEGGKIRHYLLLLLLLLLRIFSNLSDLAPDNLAPDNLAPDNLASR